MINDRMIKIVDQWRLGDRDSPPIFFIVISLWLSRFHNKSTLYIVDSLRFQYPYCEFTINSLSLSWIYFEFFIISLCLSFSLRIYSDYRESTLAFHETTIFIVNSLYIHYVYRKFTLNSLSTSRIDFGFIICFTKWLWIHSPLCKLTSCQLSFLQTDFKCTNCFMNS